MPLTYTIDRERRRLFLRATNPLTHEQGLNWIRDQIRDGYWTFDVVEDLRGTTWLPPTSEINRLSDFVAGMVKQHGPRGRVAIVVNERDALFGMLRMYTLQQDGMGVFVTFEAAEAWLNSSRRDP